MANRYTLICAFLMFPLTISAQDIARKVAVEICNSIDTIENMDSLEARIDRNATDAFESVLDEESDEIQEVYSSDEAVEETINKAMEMLLSVCPKIRKFVLEDRKAQYYQLSASESANKFYESGNKAYNEKDYMGAIKLYSKAIKKDPEFIYPIDNTGLAYRQLGDNKKAVKYYQKSLEIYPEGNFALNNLGAVYIILKQYEDALLCYQKLTFYYPEDPEGYYGIGKLLVTAGEYEKAIDYVFISHKLYTLRNSENVKDSRELVITIYNKMKEQNKLEIFKQKADEYGISVYL